MKIIQMGVGGFGQHWSRALQKAAADVVALVDTSDKALAETCELYGYDPAICFSTLPEALQQVTADLLLCITPPRYHREHVIAGLEAGLHVLCEKPMANTLEDCVAMLQAAQATGRAFAVCQNYRYRPDIQAMAHLVSRGDVGNIGQVKLDFYKGWYFDEYNFRRTMPHPMLVDMSIHHFDLLRFVTGLEAVSVRGESWNPSWSENRGDTSVSLTFTMENEARVVYNASWCAQGDLCNWNGNWFVEGDKGSILYEANQILRYGAVGRYTVSEPELIEPPEMPLAEQGYLLAHFMEAVAAGQRPHTNVADNIRSIAMVFAAVTAVETGQRVPILTPELERQLTAYEKEA